MRHVIATLAILLAATVCSDASATSGVRGTVVIGPMCPVEVAGSPCPPGVWTGTVRATAGDGAVHEATTDEDGSFSLPLPPGTYVVEAVTGAGPPSGVPADVTVPDGTFVTIDLAVDSGIR